MAMQVPIGPDLTSEEMSAYGNRIQPGLALSLNSQLKLREFYEYLDSCRITLNLINEDLVLGRLEPISEKLEHFCFEADTWGFNALYEVSLGLQMLLTNSSVRLQNEGFRETLHRGLGMLLSLLEQCERDFHWRLAIADMLDSFDQAARN
jgi:hypothetical protein